MKPHTHNKVVFVCLFIKANVSRIKHLHNKHDKNSLDLQEDKCYTGKQEQVKSVFGASCVYKAFSREVYHFTNSEKPSALKQSLSGVGKGAPPIGNLQGSML